MLLAAANRAWSNLGEHVDMRLYPATPLWHVLAGLIGFCIAFLNCERFEVRPFRRGLRRAYVAALVMLAPATLLCVRKHAVFTESAIVEQRAWARSPPASRVRRAGVSTSRAAFVWLRDGRRGCTDRLRRCWQRLWRRGSWLGGFVLPGAAQDSSGRAKRISIKTGLCVAAGKDEMNYQKELRKSKQVVREWVRANFSDEKLAGVTAFNADGKMTFRNPCGCLMGVTHSERLHMGRDCDRNHYWVARRQDLAQTRRFAALFPTSRIGRAEKAYNFLGFSASFGNCFGDDELRRRRFSALLRAEMRRRERIRGTMDRDEVAEPETILVE
jgi:hypothetical protein